MSTSADPAADTGLPLDVLTERFDTALARLESAKPFAKANHMAPVLEFARRLLTAEGGAEILYDRAERFDAAGVFHDTDWGQPGTLKPKLVSHTFEHGQSQTVTLECLSELRLLAIARGRIFHIGLSAEQAEHFLTQVLAFNLHLLFGLSDEQTRLRHASLQRLLSRQMNFIALHIGYENILDQVVEELWRILRQRPIQVDGVREMVTRVAVCLLDPEIQVNINTRGAERLVSALYGPTQACQEDPGLDVYRDRLATMDDYSLEHEAQGFARAMHDTGLVSPYTAVFVRHIKDQDINLLSATLGLSSTGREALLCYIELIKALIDQCIHPETAQSIYGLAQFLERGVLYHPGIAPALWRQMRTPLHPAVGDMLAGVYGVAHPPQSYLMAGVVSMLGQPLGLGQGDNPACQSTRALSMWSHSDPDYLLQLIRSAARDNSITMHFEGKPLVSTEAQLSLITRLSLDLDAASLVLLPHLDKIYMQMGQMVQDRGEDPHRWINPEFHGWRVHRGFAIAVDIETGGLKDLDTFIRTFYALYHPYYNANTPVVHPQPAGIAVTDSHAQFVGWHAITIMRVALDQTGRMRVYFFNPNNDSGQDWGNGVVVATEGNGEQHGESSLPIAEFTSRLYLFHYDETDYAAMSEPIPQAEVDSVIEQIHNAWGSDRSL